MREKLIGMRFARGAVKRDVARFSAVLSGTPSLRDKPKQADAQQDAIYGEWQEAMAGEEADKETHGQGGADKRNDEADEDVRPAERGDDGAAAVERVFGGGRAQERQTKQETELGGAHRPHADEVTGHHRRHGTAHAGPESEALNRADGEGPTNGQVGGEEFGRVGKGGGIGACFFTQAPAFGEDHEAGAEEERPGDGLDGEKLALDEVLERERGDHGRDAGEHQIAQEAQAGGIASAQAGQDGEQFAPIQDGDREDGARLDDDRVGVGGFLQRDDHTIFIGRHREVGVETESVVGDDEMAGGGDGQKLGDTLDHTQDEAVAQRRTVGCFVCFGGGSDGQRGGEQNNENGETHRSSVSHAKVLVEFMLSLGGGGGPIHGE